MNQSPKKSIKKKKPNGIKTPDKFKEKIKVQGSFTDLLKKAIGTPIKKKK